MYIIRDSSTGTIIFGPHIWDKHLFQQKMYAVAGIEKSVPYANPDNKVVEVTDTIKIYPVVDRVRPQINSKIEFHDGPYYDYDDTTAYRYFLTGTKSLEQAKQMFRDNYKHHRWNKEENGVAVTINETDYLISTKREDRTLLFYGSPGYWKLNKILRLDEFNAPYNDMLPKYVTTQEWVDLSQEHLDSMIAAVKQHVKLCFDWEKQALEPIESATTLEQINELEILLVI